MINRNNDFVIRNNSLQFHKVIFVFILLLLYKYLIVVELSVFLSTVKIFSQNIRENYKISRSLVYKFCNY